MGNRNWAEAETESSLSEALLFAIMCIIGLPVDVHVRDGSVYSGIFYTASVDKDFGIILKEAKLIRNGKCDGNVGNGSVIETLVILSGDLIQVVAKGDLFPADGAVGNVASDNAERAMFNVPSEIIVSEAKEANNLAMDKNKINENSRISTKKGSSSAKAFMPKKAGNEYEGRKILPDHAATATEVEPGKRGRINISESGEDFNSTVNGRQIGDNGSQAEQDHNKQKSELQRERSDNEVQSSSSISGLCLLEAKAVVEQTTMKSLPNEGSCDPKLPLVKPDSQCFGSSASSGSSSVTAVCSSISTASNVLVDVAAESHSGLLAPSADVVSPQSSESNKSSKEFKLNPGAKIFCPSFVTPISATMAAPAVASMVYIPSNSPVVPIAAAQPEVGISPFVPRPSVPAKFAPYTNLMAVNGASGHQFSQPITGNRTQPLRYAAQYHPVQATPTYVPPNSQAAMIGRLGQLVYVQPVAHDLVQSTATMSSVSACPLLTSHQVQYPKHQGTAAGQALQLCAPPPFGAGGQQPFAMPSHIPLLQPPIPANRPVPVPGSNALFGAKFP
ncbi:uncharacterized protein LOC110602412 isoform X3 [Manihot esculenta]|uniref:Ataxin 2 SM domain-containing protein n=1 Tax=Manihot esculenta TaxID=3983 RepID=A0A2C9UEW2_MANES|nr:uncharacterized protein LOC110602412 isoform X3 [Manihot esculenta]OAY28514.1 hypothetical protein MANES_15G072600v8 [Manihot esculenta]